MTLNELEKILMNISMDANSVGNAQYSMIVGATLNMIKSVENLSQNVYTIPFNDSCKSMMIQKMTELESYTSNAVMLRLAELGIDVSMYYGFGAGDDFGGQQQPWMRQQPAMMPQQMMMQQPMMQPMMQQHFMQQPMMQQPMMQQPMPQQQMPQQQLPQQPAAQPVPQKAPAATPAPPAASPAPSTPAATPPTAPASTSGGVGASMALPGLGGGAAEAAGPAYLLKIINGEV